MPTTAPSPKRHSFRIILSAMWRRKAPFLVSLSAATVYIAAVLVTPLIGQLAIDEAIIAQDYEMIIPIIGALMVLAFVRSISGGIRKYQAGKLMASVGIDMRERLFEHLQRLSFSYHDRLGPGQLMSRASSDVTMMETAVAMSPFFAQSLVLAAGGVVILFVLQPLLAAAVLGTVGLLGFFTLRLARPIHASSRQLQEQVGEFSQFIEQRINGIRVVKGHGLESVHREQGRLILDRVHDNGVEVARLRGRFMGVFLVTPASAILVVVALGGWLSMRGTMTPGQLFAFLQYLGALVAPVMVGAQAMAIWPQAMASTDRIVDVIETRPDLVDPPHPRGLPRGPGTIHFERVSFGYEAGARVLHQVDLEVPGGTSVALVGLTGCGKSTVARLIPRFYDPREGRVLLDGTPVDSIRLEELRRAVSIVFEDTVLFGGTISENIALGMQSSDEQIRRAAQLAQAEPFILELPQGYNTVVGEQGMTLSGGQRQRLAIARAILRDPRVLILDDAMSAVDPTTDEAIRLGLREVMRDRTTLIIAHRVETLVLADRVILMDLGRIVAEGRHEDLLRVADYRRALGLDTRMPVS